MIQNYTTKNGANFQTVTLPKGIVLFRGIYFEEGMRHEKIFSDLLGYRTGNYFKISPTFNTFFYPAPYVSQCVDQFNIHIIYTTNVDLELLLLIKPSVHHRGLRKDSNNPLHELIDTCTSISDKDACGFEMKEADPCFTNEILQSYPQIKGYIAIAKSDKDRFYRQYKLFFDKHQNMNKINQMLPTMLCDTREFIGIPEIVIHPHSNRQLSCDEFDMNINATPGKRFIDDPSQLINHCIRSRARYNYFPLLYITESGAYTIQDLRNKELIYSFQILHTTVPLYYKKLFENIHKAMNEAMSPTGILINNTRYYFTFHLKTGFYICSTVVNQPQSHTNNLSQVNINILDEINSTESIIPFIYPKDEKMRIIKSLGFSNVFPKKDTELDIEHKLNKHNYSLSKQYIFNRGDPSILKRRFYIEKVLARPDLDSKLSSMKKINKTRKNKH